MVSKTIAVVALAAASLFSGALSKPVHRRHQNVHVERRDYHVDKVVVQVYVWVDQNGNTISSSVTSKVHRQTPVKVYEPSPAPAKTTTPAPPPPPPTTFATKKTTPAAAYTPKPEPEPKPEPKPETPVASTGKIGRGITWSKILPGGCKDAGTVQSELQKIKSEGYETIRLYANDCGQDYDVLKFAVQNGLNVILGVFRLEEPSYSQELGAVMDAVKKVSSETGKDAWAHVPLVGIGNEMAFKGNSPAVYKPIVAAAKATLRAAGYGGVVATIEMWGDVKRGDVGCGTDDDAFVPVNMHSFFDGSCTAGDTGTFLAAQIRDLEANYCKGKKIVIVETGWPHSGGAHLNRAGDRTATRPNQQLAINSIKGNLEDYVILSAFDEPWKGAQDTPEATEKFWGIY